MCLYVYIGGNITLLRWWRNESFAIQGNEFNRTPTVGLFCPNFMLFFSSSVIYSRSKICVEEHGIHIKYIFFLNPFKKRIMTVN